MGNYFDIIKDLIGKINNNCLTNRYILDNPDKYGEYKFVAYDTSGECMNIDDWVELDWFLDRTSYVNNKLKRVVFTYREFPMIKTLGDYVVRGDEVIISKKMYTNKAFTSFGEYCLEIKYIFDLKSLEILRKSSKFDDIRY